MAESNDIRAYSSITLFAIFALKPYYFIVKPYSSLKNGWESIIFPEVLWCSLLNDEVYNLWLREILYFSIFYPHSSQGFKALIHSEGEIVLGNRIENVGL